MNQTISDEQYILITVKKGDSIELRTFSNDAYGKRQSVKFCNDLAKEHLKHPFNRLMDYADKKNDSKAKDFLKEQPFEKPQSLAIKTEIIEKELYDILYA